MLVLSRRMNERVIIPCIQAAVQVLGIQNGQVRLGFDAPADVKVFREEVCPLRPTADGPLAPRERTVRSRLRGVGAGLDLLRRQLRGQLTPTALAALERVQADFRALAGQVEELMGGTSGGPPAAEPLACSQL
jgi:carbon storage regulator CsrA